MRKGDIIENGWTTEDNPYHLSMYIGTSGEGHHATFNAIAYNGRVLHHCKDNNKITVVGHITEYDTLVKVLKELDKSAKKQESKHD